jgi:D-glycero-alpha-D-manno-heptose-7-phosphate kinase
MILAKAPLRVSFFGGGSDIPAHYLQWGGSTISTAIDKYVYVAIGRTPQNHIKVNYSKQELVYNVDDIQNEIVKNALKFFGIKSNIEITTFADIPTVGTGLAGSSAFTCALVAALAEYFCAGKRYSEYELAEAACHIEINMCGWNIGKQDQYASAFGGMNYIRYSNSDRVFVSKIDPKGIDSNMLLLPTNIQRHAAEVLNKIDFEDKMPIIRELSLMADRNSYEDPTLELYGPLLNEAWKYKKQMEGGISNPEIDDMYERCREAGAVGAKLLGAGGGGYMLALTDNKNKLRAEFNDRCCLEVRVALDGAKVVYKD